MSSNTPLLVALTNAYKLLSRSLTDPAGWLPTLASTFAEPFAAMARPLPALAQEVADCMRAASKDPVRLSVAYAKLFLGPFQVEASPYASHYLDPERQLMGPVSQAVADAYAEAGMGPGPGPRDAPDHIAHELEFMYVLGFEAAQTSADIWTRRAARFWNTHMGRWLPDFAQAIIQAGLHPCYDGIGRLLLEFARAEAIHFTGVAGTLSAGTESADLNPPHGIRPPQSGVRTRTRTGSSRVS